MIISFQVHVFYMVYRASPGNHHHVTGSKPARMPSNLSHSYNHHHMMLSQHAVSLLRCIVALNPTRNMCFLKTKPNVHDTMSALHTKISHFSSTVCFDFAALSCMATHFNFPHLYYTHSPTPEPPQLSTSANDYWSAQFLHKTISYGLLLN